MVYTIRDIPSGMRRYGWTVAAGLMDRWFAKKSRVMTDPEKQGRILPKDWDDSIVTMAWAMRFERARSARDRLIRGWSEPKRLARARPFFEPRLRAWPGIAGVKAGSEFRFGDLSQPTATVDSLSQLNFETVSSGVLGTLDGFYAAIGTGSIKIAVSGMARPGTGAAKGRIRLSIDEVGLYLRDTYDFNDDQMLGQWGPGGVGRIGVLAPSIPIAQDDVTTVFGWTPAEQQAFFSVNNSDFRHYRDRFQRGGDFIVFSDVERRRLATPVVMEF